MYVELCVESLRVLNKLGLQYVSLVKYSITKLKRNKEESQDLFVLDDYLYDAQ